MINSASLSMRLALGFVVRFLSTFTSSDWPGFSTREVLYREASNLNTSSEENPVKNTVRGVKQEEKEKPFTLIKWVVFCR